MAIGHVLSEVKEVLRRISALNELFTHLPLPWFLGFKASPLDVTVNSVELLLVGKDVCLMLVLLLFFLVGGFLVSPAIVISWRCHREASSSFCLVGVRVGLHRGMAQIILEQVEDGCWLAADDSH